MRRTKEEAAQTRAAILEAALACFDRYGITNATLEQIACAAGVSRGAVYHHFSGKRAILREIREHVSLPLLDAADTALLRADGGGVLERIERFLAAILEGLERDARKRQALTVMQFRCEYVDELGRELHAGLRNLDRLTKAIERAYTEAARVGELCAALTPEIAALETVTFMNGLVRLWLAHGGRSGLRRNARALIAAHIALRRASPR